MYGDKDTFRLAFALAGKSTSFEQARCNLACQDPNSCSASWCRVFLNSLQPMVGAGRQSLSFQQLGDIPMRCMQVSIPPSCPLDASSTNVRLPSPLLSCAAGHASAAFESRHLSLQHLTSSSCVHHARTTGHVTGHRLKGATGILEQLRRSNSRCNACIREDAGMSRRVGELWMVTGFSLSQAEPVTYLHAGMIQHDPSGIPTFLHRTAEGKVYPFNNGYRKVSPGSPCQLTLMGPPCGSTLQPGI